MKRIILPIVVFLISHFSNAQVCTKAQLPINLQNGLVAFYPFCGNANDVSGNSHNGTVFGATLSSDRFNLINNAYSFNPGNYINLPAGIVWSNLKGVSFSAWAKFNSIVTSAGGGNTVIELTDGSTSNQWPHRYFIVQDDNKIHFILEGTSTNGGFRVSSKTIAINQNQWYHIVGVISNNQALLYINGVLVSTVNIPISSFNLGPGFSNNKRVGMATQDGWSKLNGLVDDIFIFNRALSNCEVQQLYTSTNTTFTTPSILIFNPLPSQTSLCGSSIGLDAGSGFTSYLWNTGATSQTISATTAGEYRVTVTNASGCTASDTVNFSLVKADILQSDQTVCVNTPLTLSINSYANQSAKTIDFDNLGIAALDATGGTASLITGVSGNGLSISRPTEVKTKDQTYGYGDYEVDAKTGNNTSNQYLSVLLPSNSWTNEAISIDSRPAGTDDVGWGIYVNGVRVAFATGSNPANASSWYKMKIRVTPDSVKCWINSTLLYQGLNTTVPRNIGAVKLSTFSTSHFDNLKYTPYQTYSSVLWSTAATTSTISVTPTATTTYYATISDGISSCRDSVTLTVANIVGFNPLQDTVKVCGDSVLLDAGAGYATYNWSNGATTRTTTAKTFGKYFVSVANVSGCSASDTSIVSIVKAKIIQRDTTICKGSSVTLAIDSSFSGRTVCNKSDLPIDLQNGLVAYYPFCGNANDKSGNNNDGSVVGATLTNDRFGNANSAYQFNGQNNFIRVPHSDVLNLSGDFTLSCWFLSEVAPAYRTSHTLLAKRDDRGACCSPNVPWHLSINFQPNILTDYKKPLMSFSKNGSYRYVQSPKQIAINLWQNIIATYSQDTIKIYLDGKIIHKEYYANSDRMSNTSDMLLGAINRELGAEYLQGKLDDIFIYNRCVTQGEIYQLSNSSINSVLWSTGATTSSITVNPTVKTTYTVTVTDGITTCRDSIVVDLSSSELKVTDPAAVCSPGVIDLTTAAITSGSAAGLTYTYWRDANATQALGSPDKISISGTYYIVGKSATGCTSAPTAVKVTINPLPVATIVTPSQTTICDKSTLTLTATGGTSYQWLLNGTVIAGATSSTYAASLAGSYEVNVIALGCTSKVAAPVNLSLIKASVPKFSNSSTCIDVPVSFFNETTDTASVNFIWNFGDGQTSTLVNPVYTYKRSGAFVVKLRVTPKLCSSLSDSITKNLTVDVPPVGIKYPNVLAVKNKATQLSARFIANGYTYLWMPSTGLNNGVIQKPVFNASQEQLYRVRLTSAGGCITMDTVKVSVYDSSDIFVPKAFTPNRDGKNDLLQPFLVNITTLKFFRVYNRWGQLMFQTSDSKQGWDGMYNSKPQPIETYTWIAEGIDGNGTTIFRKGQTALIR